MDVAPSTAHRLTKRKRPNGRSLIAAKHYPPALDALEQVLRAAIAATGIRVYSNRVKHLLSIYRWAHRRGRVDGATFRTTRAQMAAAVGLSDATCIRGLTTLEELGLLRRRSVARHASSNRPGVRQRAGMTQCLEVELLPTVGPDAAPALRTIINVT